MGASLSFSEEDALEAVVNFLAGLLPNGTPIVRGQQNRVPEVAAVNFVQITPILRKRLATNLVSSGDCAFLGSITTTTLTVSSLLIGTITAGLPLYGPGVTGLPLIQSQVSGAPGGIGVYMISSAQTITDGTKMAAGIISEMQATEWTVQCEVHGDASADMVQCISTFMRSAYACEFFEATAFDMAPLEAEDPRQSPFDNAEQQYEANWTIDLKFQLNQVASISQQYLDQITLGIYSVDAINNPTSISVGPAY